MKAQDHYTRAAELLTGVELIGTGTDQPIAPDMWATNQIAAARVHAIQALTAAIIDASFRKPDSPVLAEWNRAIHQTTHAVAS